MVTATALGLQVSRRINDISQVAVTAAGILDFVNMAIDDLAAAGWLQPMNEDVSLIALTDTFDYAVPAGFAYVRKLMQADSDGSYPLSRTIPDFAWEMGMVSGVAKFHFAPELADLIDGLAIKVVGQKRPTGNLAGGASIVSGMEAFIRERAAAYAAEFLAAGDSELSQRRAKLSDSCWAKSQAMLGQHPQEFRVKINSRVVPGA